MHFMMQSRDAQASSFQNVQDSRAEPPHRAAHKRPSGVAPVWWVVCSRELIELWVGGKALILILLFCLVQGGIAYSLLGDVDPTPREEMLYLTVKMAMAVGVFMRVIIGADSISGERERGTLEALLLTPGSRRQIVI